MMRPVGKPVSLLLILAFAAIHAAIAILSLRLATVNASASPFWPASGLALLGLIRQWRGVRTGIFLGALLANTTTAAPWSAIVVIACGNLWEALAAYWIYQKILRRFSTESHLQPVFAITAAAILGATVGAFTGLSGLLWAKALSWTQVTSSFLTWWGGDAVGIMLVAPLALGFPFPATRSWSSLSWRVLLTSSILLFCAWMTFKQDGGGGIFLLFLPLLVSAWCLDGVWLSLTALVIALVAVVCAAGGRGPFLDLLLNDNLIGFQLLLGTLALSAMSLQNFIMQVPKRQILPLLFLGWTLSGVLFFFFHERYRSQDTRHFESLVQQARDEIDEMMESYHEILYGAAGFVAATEDVSRTQFADYLKTAHIFERFPAMKAIGWVVPVPSAQLMEYEQGMKKAYGAEFQVHGIGLEKHDLPQERFIVQYIEPLQGNEAALGLDVGSEIERRSTLEQARRTRSLQMTAPLVLTQGSAENLGLLFYMPVYAGTRFKGWISGVFVVEKIMNEALLSVGKELDLVLYASEASHLSIYRTTDEFRHLEKQTTLLLGGKKFRAAVGRAERFEYSKDLAFAWVGAFGCLLTLALARVITTSAIYRRRAEEEVAQQMQTLAARDRLWQTLMECSPVGIFQIAADGNPTYSNRMWQQLSGVTSLTGTSSERWSRLHPDDRLRLMPIWADSLAQGKPLREEFRLRTPEGRITWVKVHTAPIINDDSRVEGYVGIAVDITERKLREAEVEKERLKLIQATKMASLGEMASGIAHEINNPLAVINAISCHLRHKAEQIPPDLVEGVVQIEEMSARIAKIIRGLRAFSRNADKDPIRPVSLNTIVAETLALCASRFQASQIQIHVQPIPELNVGCRGGQLSQVLLNLLSNAHDASVHSKDPWVSIEAELLDSVVRLKIKDSGPGVDPAHVNRIMEPFFTTKEVDRGTGLGLSIAKGIVEDHGGRLYLDLDSEDTCFVLELKAYAQVRSA